MSTAVQQSQQQSADYDIGFASGARAAHLTRDRQLSSMELVFVAHGHYVQASRSVVLIREDFEAGWRDGYRAYFQGII